MDRELRAYSDSLELKNEDEGKKKQICGYINKFNTRSQYMGFYEEVSNNAFDKTLADGHNIYAMYNHDDDKILGSTRSGNLRLFVDDIGLRFELDINENISYARDLYELVSNNDINGCSFGFYVNNDTWSRTEEGIDLRIINEVELIEVTITPFPAYLDSEASCRSYDKFKEQQAEEFRKAKEQRELDLILMELELMD